MSAISLLNFSGGDKAQSVTTDSGICLPKNYIKLKFGLLSHLLV